MVISNGTQDLSTRVLPRVPEAIPQHLPKFYIYAETGPLTPQLVVGNERQRMYGANTFDEIGPYTTHSTIFANQVNAQGNACMLQRVVPIDAAAEANLIVGLDVLQTTIDLYQRNPDGSIMRDSLTGNPTIIGTTTGYKIKWTTKYRPSTVKVGETPMSNGNQVDPSGMNFPNNSGTKSNILATNLVRNNEYVIVSTTSGNGAATDFTLIGADNNNVGTVFTATGSGTGTGLASTTTGTNTSYWYPIFELKTSFQGEYGNLAGIRLWAPTINTIATMPTQMMSTDYAYPYYISVIRKPDANSSPNIQTTLFGDTRTMVTFKPKVTDPLTNVNMYIGDVFIDAYRNLTNQLFPQTFGDFDTLYVYNNNIETVLSQFFESELPYFDIESDFRLGSGASYDLSQKHLFNFVSLTDSNGIPYQSVIFTNDATSVQLGPLSNVYAMGGSDGTMHLSDKTIDNQAFANLVTNALHSYTDPNDPVQDVAVNVESIFYDTGFPIATKQALCGVLAIRNDTFVVLSTYIAPLPVTKIVNGSPVVLSGPEVVMDSSTEFSLATSLLTFLQNYPESDYFGTPVMRGMIIGRSAHLRNSNWLQRLPLSLEVAIKAAAYMGAGNGAWKSGYSFDSAPLSVVDHMYDISISWVPASTRNAYWDVGLNWVQAYDRRSFFFPALKTVYDNDTSVLNSFFTAMAICQLYKVINAAWRDFSGVSHLSNAQLAQRINDYITSAVQNKFDSRFTIKPKAYFTNDDVLRNFSVTVPVEIYAQGMKTILTASVVALRASDLQATA